MSDLSILPSNAVAINGTRPVTTSLVIADVFGKRHDNVLRQRVNRLAKKGATI